MKFINKILKEDSYFSPKVTSSKIANRSNIIQKEVPLIIDKVNEHLKPYSSFKDFLENILNVCKEYNIPVGKIYSSYNIRQSLIIIITCDISNKENLSEFIQRIELFKDQYYDIYFIRINNDVTDMVVNLKGLKKV